MELPKNWKVDCKDIETFDKVWKKFKPNNKETDPDRRYIFYRNRPSFPVCFYTAFTHVFTSESSFTEVSVEDVLREFEKDDSGKKALHSLVIGPFEDCHEKVLVITHLINLSEACGDEIISGSSIPLRYNTFVEKWMNTVSYHPNITPSDFVEQYGAKISKSDHACEYVNVRFTSYHLACKHCGRSQI